MTATQARAEVDENRCIGNGDCARVAPLAFALDDGTDTARVRSTAWNVAGEDLIDVAMCCPTQAIRIFGDNGERLF